MPSVRRPPRAVLEQLIRETGGSMTKLASRLDVTRPTAYTWVYQLDLADLVGIRPREEPMPAPQKVALPEGSRVPVTVRLDAGLWRALRIRALEEDRPASDLVEDATRRYLASAKGTR